MIKWSFKEIIDKTFEKKSNWDYYAASETEFDYNPVDSLENSRKFLKDFIKISAKGNDNPLYCEINKLGERATHVVSTFFVGHFLYEKTGFKTLINDEINKLIVDNHVTSDVCFSFIWFLTCLFHDLGYKIEDSKNLKYNSFDSLYNSLNNKLPQINGIPKFYNQIYKNYFAYRIKERDKNDHGIVAAHLLYDSLHKIREFAEKNPTESQKKLCWEKQLLEVYNFCAWNILGHNIWFVKEKDKNCNHYENMPDLILKKEEYKIKYKDHPFFFFFCLVDTIEPYKKVLDYDSLDKVYLEIEENKLIISTDLRCSCGKEVIKQAKSLNNWLVSANELSNGSVEINLKM